MEVYVRAEVWYTCELDDDQARQVVKYMAENYCSAEYAVDMLYNQGNFGLYDSSVESDFSTEEIEDVHFESDDDRLLIEYGLLEEEEEEEN